MTNNSLFLVGGTGGLGGEVAKGLVKAEGFDNFVALVRPSSVDKAESLKALGWTVEPADFSSAETLTSAMAGAKVVVSTASGTDLAELEKKVIDAAKAAGASLFVPSQFGVDCRRWDMSFPFMQMKAAVLKHAKEVGMPTLEVYTGAFADQIWFFLMDVKAMTANLVGDGSAKFSFTKRSDIGFVLAKALADPAYANGGHLSMESESITWAEAIELLEKVLGKKFEITRIDPDDALVQEKALLEKGDMGSFYAAFTLHLLGAPARGYTGFDVSKESNTYGVELEPLEKTVKAVFGGE